MLARKSTGKQLISGSGVSVEVEEREGKWLEDLDPSFEMQTVDGPDRMSKEIRCERMENKALPYHVVYNLTLQCLLKF